MRATLRSVIGAGIGLLSLAACAAPGSVGAGAGSNSGSTSSSSAPADAGLDGRTFLSTRVTGHTLVKGSRIRVSFERAGSVGFQAGCNSMGGQVDTSGGRLSTSDLAMTEMGCEKPLMDQDTWLAAFIGGKPSWILDGDVLSLSSGDVTITLADRKVADPDRPLDGTTWQLTGLIDGDAASSVPAGVEVRVEFRNGTVSFDNCNFHGGPYVVRSGTIQVTPMSESAVSCTGPQGSTEQSVSAVLTANPTFEIAASSLTISAANGTGLMFTAVDEPATAPPSASSTPQPPTAASTTPAATTGSAPPATASGSGSPGSTGGAGPTRSPDPTDSPGSTGQAASNPLAGRTFKMVRMFTDAGGADTRVPGARFVITFGDHDATAVSQCGKHTYSDVDVASKPEGLGIKVTLGTPSGPACDLGNDPPGIPSDVLYFGQDKAKGEFWLSTGFVAWIFTEVTR